MKNTNQITPENFFKEIRNKNISYLSRAITLIESNNTEHQKKASQILNNCLPYANNAVRIGITGVPGVGKSTFIEVFGNFLTTIGKKVAVLAVDPSSTINKGSILGDKTRMNELALNKNAFIRPSPSGDTLGGVAKKTRETITLCEAAGFDVIIIETVGVGQSEVAVHSMVDFFLLLKLANSGDELQGIKRGIIEMADAIVINKADSGNEAQANHAKNEFIRALHLYPIKESEWSPTVSVCSSLNNSGIESVYTQIEKYLALTKKNGYFYSKRKEQNKSWFFDTINNGIKKQFYENPAIQKVLDRYLQKIGNQELNAFTAAQEILKIKK